MIIQLAFTCILNLFADIVFDAKEIPFHLINFVNA